jgi:hypothetical protein
VFLAVYFFFALLSKCLIFPNGYLGAILAAVGPSRPRDFSTSVERRMEEEKKNRPNPPMEEEEKNRPNPPMEEEEKLAKSW